MVNEKMVNIKDYIAANKARFMEEYYSLLRIPSISCESAHQPDMLRCAERWKELLLEAGCQHAATPSSMRSIVQQAKVLRS